MTTPTTRTPARLARREIQLAEARVALVAAGADEDECDELLARVVHMAGPLALMPTAYLHGDPMAGAARNVLDLHRRQADGAVPDPEQPRRPRRRAQKGRTS